MKSRWFNEEKLPYICTPLIGRNTDELIDELTSIVLKKPDVIEWRVDFYEDIADFGQVLATAQAIYENSNGIPVLFTIRSDKEGGESISLSEGDKVELISELCKSDFIAMVDYELSSEPSDIQRVREISREHGKGLVLSYHNFGCTPTKPEILKQILLAEFYGADVAKASVMPLDKQDVLTLLEVTREAAEMLTIPVLTISMGALGSMSRVMGWMYGSVMTFAVGANSSAPGQIPIEDLRNMIGMAKRFAGVQE